MNIISYKPSHDGAIAYIMDAELRFSVESEKNSNFRYSDLSIYDLFNVLEYIDGAPDIFCTSGWWPREGQINGDTIGAGYFGVSEDCFVVGQRRWMGKTIRTFSSSHERSHIMCAFGMSELPKGTACYALVWEGVIGAFYEIDSDLTITKLADVMDEPGHRYALLYGLADQTFKKNSGFSRFSDAGKLMALAAYSNRRTATAEELGITDFLLQRCFHLRPSALEELRDTSIYEVGLEDPEFRNFAGVFSDRIFDEFYQRLIPEPPVRSTYCMWLV